MLKYSQTDSEISSMEPATSHHSFVMYILLVQLITIPYNSNYILIVTSSKALVSNSFFVTTSKAPVTTSVALVPSSNPCMVYMFTGHIKW